MLTGDLLRVRVRGRELVPALVDPARPALQEVAGSLIELFAEAVAGGWKRAALDEEIHALIGDRRDHKLVRGLAKVLSDRAEFEVRSPMPPAELRAIVFRTARQAGPLALEAGPLGRPVAADVLAAVGEALGLDADTVAEALYADRREEERIVTCAVPDATWLLHRYNVALVQAVLLRASALELRLEGPSVPRVRQLFRHVKFHELIHHATRDDTALVVRLDGPGSLFKLSTRYGAQLAAFFPALLLQDCPWSMHAEVLWTRARHRKDLRLSSADGLRSHYRDTGAYTTRTHQWFAERFEKLDSGWTMSDDTEPIDLGGRALVLPDVRFAKDGRTAFLEIIGFWRRDYLERRVAWLTRYGPGNLVLAVSRRLLADKDALRDFPGTVIPFAEVVPAKQVLAAIEEVAR